MVVVVLRHLITGYTVTCLTDLLILYTYVFAGFIVKHTSKLSTGLSLYSFTLCRVSLSIHLKVYNVLGSCFMKNISTLLSSPGKLAWRAV